MPSFKTSPFAAWFPKFALLCTAATAFVGGSAIAGTDDVSRLIRRSHDGARAFVSGDMRRWWQIFQPIGQDFTLMQPFGGVTHGFNSTTKRLDEMQRFFKSGTANFELIQSYTSPDMIVLVFIERQRMVIGDLPEQDWSLRVTQIYRRRGPDWETVHRHADVAVANIGLERTAQWARASALAANTKAP